jgi:2OG-Fe(II) oxygenase superfamily
MEQFNLIDGFFEEEKLIELQTFFQTNVFWTYGWQSDHARLTFSHWNHEFLNTPRVNQQNEEQVLLGNEKLKPISDLWLKLKSNYLKGHSLVRCYANAHTFGVEGYIHSDSKKPGNYTTIVYLNPVWDPDWAGETVFITDSGDIAYAVLPKPGRITIFDGRIQHAARGVSRSCPAMRATLMFKTTTSEVENDSVKA